jgi:hypothetical protein
MVGKSIVGVTDYCRASLSLTAVSLLSCLPLLLSSCGAGTAAVIGGMSGSDGGTGNAGTVGAGVAVTNGSGSGRAVASPATIRFNLTDQEGDPGTVSISYAQSAAGSFKPITVYSESNSLSGIPTDGSAYEILWDFELDLASALQANHDYLDDVTIRLEVSGGLSPSPLEDVAVGNGGPALSVVGHGHVTPGGEVTTTEFRDIVKSCGWDFLITRR